WHVLGIEIVIREAEVGEARNRELARGGLPELRRDRAPDRHRRHVAPSIVAGIRQMPADPARAGIGARDGGVGRPPDAPRLIVRHAVARIAAALHYRDL